MALNKDYRISWGIIALLFGCLLLLQYFHLIPAFIAKYVLRPEISILIAGFIFLCFRKTRSAGVILIILGLILCFAAFFLGVLNGIHPILWPIVLLLMGILLLFLLK